MIAMVAISMALAAKQAADAKRAAAKQANIQATNAANKAKIEREMQLKARAEAGSKASLSAYEKSRQSRVQSAQIMVATGEQGASTGSFQTNAMLQGLGFNVGLQQAVDERSAANASESSDLAIKAGDVNFNNTMRTINSKRPKGGSGDILMAAGVAGMQTYAGAGGSFGGGSTTPSSGGVTGGNQVNPRGGV
jgi:hypothetical protein